MPKKSIARLIDLLHEKCFYLDRFLEESSKERPCFKARKFENLENLYRVRENLLTNISSIDQRIQSLSTEVDKSEIEDSEKAKISKLFDQIKEKVRYILEEDLTLISCIENEKSKILKSIAKTHSGRKAIQGYRSPNNTEV